MCPLKKTFLHKLSNFIQFSGVKQAYWNICVFPIPSTAWILTIFTVTLWGQWTSEVAQLCLTLCDPMDYHQPGSIIHGIFQARVLDGLPFPSPGDLPNPGIEPRSPTLQADALLSEPQGKPYTVGDKLNLSFFPLILTLGYTYTWLHMISQRVHMNSFSLIQSPTTPLPNYSFSLCKRSSNLSVFLLRGIGIIYFQETKNVIEYNEWEGHFYIFNKIESSGKWNYCTIKQKSNL